MQQRPASGGDRGVREEQDDTCPGCDRSVHGRHPACPWCWTEAPIRGGRGSYGSRRRGFDKGVADWLCAPNLGGCGFPNFGRNARCYERSQRRGVVGFDVPYGLWAPRSALDPQGGTAEPPYLDKNSEAWGNCFRRGQGDLDAQEAEERRGRAAQEEEQRRRQQLQLQPQQLQQQQPQSQLQQQHRQRHQQPGGAAAEELLRAREEGAPLPGGVVGLDPSWSRYRQGEATRSLYSDSTPPPARSPGPSWGQATATPRPAASSVASPAAEGVGVQEAQTRAEEARRAAQEAKRRAEEATRAEEAARVELEERLRAAQEEEARARAQEEARAREAARLQEEARARRAAQEAEAAAAAAAAAIPLPSQRTPEQRGGTGGPPTGCALVSVVILQPGGRFGVLVGGGGIACL